MATKAMNPTSSGMQRCRVAITRALPPEAMDRFRARHDVWVNPADRVLTPVELMQRAGEADVIVVTAFDKFDANVIAALPPTLKILATHSVGLEHIDIKAATARGLPVLATPDVLSDAVAEMAILLMLGASRRAQEGDRLVYSGQWKGWTPTQLVGVEVTGRRMGILGMGRIGRTIAQRARGFDMAVQYHNRQRLAADLEQGAAHHATLQGLLAASDVLVLAAPSTPETRGLLNGRTIAELPKGAIVVNIARGDLIDDDALIAALTSGHLAAAGLDVFNGEPRLDERYKGLPNVFLQPHQGSSTLTARLAMAQILLDGIEAVLAGKAPINRVA